jgi:hypothetical protein
MKLIELRLSWHLAQSANRSPIFCDHHGDVQETTMEM